MVSDLRSSHHVGIKQRSVQRTCETTTCMQDAGVSFLPFNGRHGTHARVTGEAGRGGAGRGEPLNADHRGHQNHVTHWAI